MGFLDNVKKLSGELAGYKDEHVSERGTINAFVNPLLSLLGHAPSRLSHVVHEFTADIGTKRGEKVDIAVLRDGKPIILIECKKLNTKLGPGEISQLYRYFGTTDTRIGVLTNGLVYMFFSDTEKQNVMDRTPFFTFDLLDFTDAQAQTLERFTRACFDDSEILDTARVLKHAASVESRIAGELADPSNAFVDFFARPVHQGLMTAEVRERFRDVVVAGIRQFVERRTGNMPQPDSGAVGIATTPGKRLASRAGDHGQTTPPSPRALQGRRGPTMLGAVLDFLQRSEGGTVAETNAHLATLFPDHEMRKLDITTRDTISRQHRRHGFNRRSWKDPARSGTVYQLFKE